MDFQLRDEHRQLADSLERVLENRYDFEHRKEIVADGGRDAVWRDFGQLGLFSLQVSEDGGGFGDGAVDLLRPMALAGRARSPDRGPDRLRWLRRPGVGVARHRPCRDR